MQKAHSLLLIEDDQTLGKLYESLLQEDGYRVCWHQSALPALDQIAQQEFDLILLDVMLPEMSGLEALEKLGTKSQSTVMLTNLDHSRVLSEVTRNGALGYIIKSEHTPDSFLLKVSDFLTKVDQYSALST